MKAQFIGSLSIVSLGGRWWAKNDWLRYYSAIYNPTTAIPPGFVYDGVSRPILSYPTAASLVHDFHYRYPFIKRLQADRMFNEAMKAEGRFLPVRWLKTGVLYAIGWPFHKNQPGALDFRICRNCQWGVGPKCKDWCDSKSMYR